MGRTGEGENAEANKQMAAMQKAQYDKTNAGIDEYLGKVRALDAQGNPYKNSDYLRNQNVIASSAISGTNKAAQDQLEQATRRTGLNSASLDYTKAEMNRDAMRTRASQEAGVATDNYDKWLDYDKWLTGAYVAPWAADTSMFATSTQGRDAALGNLTQLGLASYGPVNAAIGAAGTAVAGACPAKGSLISLGDGRKVAVEQLVFGDPVLHSDGSSTPLPHVPVPENAPCKEVATANGKGGCASCTHTFILGRGGYQFAHSALKEIILTDGGSAEVVNVNDAGERPVYPLHVGGNHTYCADGIWALE